MTSSSSPLGRTTAIRLQLLGWMTLGAVYFVLDLPMEREALPILAARAAVWACLGWLSSRALLWIYSRARVQEYLSPAPHRVGTLVVGSVVGAVLGGAVWFVLFNLVDWWVGIESGFISPLEWDLEQLLSELITFVFPMLAWHGMVLSLQQWAQLVTAREQTERSERLAREAQLRMLRYQLNPHFLFNTLNSVIALVDEDGPRAEAMLLQLCDVLRHTLRDAEPTSTVRAELTVIRDYLALEGVRFEDHLTVVESIDDDTLDCTIPPLLLHPLVDNAIRYGFEQRSRVAIDVRAHRSGDTLILEVINDGRLAPSESPGHGIGSRNVRERLTAFPGNHEFTVEQVGDRVHARVELQLQAPGGPS